MKTKAIFLICVTLLLTTCRKFNENPHPRDVAVSIETGLTQEGAFLNNEYLIKYTVEQINRVSNFPVTATYTISQKAVVTIGAKQYSESDTIRFEMKTPREIKVKPTETGNYRLTMTFKDDRGTEVGMSELNFNVETPNLDVYFVRNGSRVESLDQMQNLLEYEGTFIVRATSQTEELNKGRLTLTAGITGTSVQVKNWKDKEAKISQADDSPYTVDFVVEYKNIQLGVTDFVFTAETQNNRAELSSSMTVEENKPGTLSLPETSRDPQTHVYSRRLLWVGETDTVKYEIIPDPQMASNMFRMRFEVSDGTKLWLFNTGDPAQQFAENMYEPNKWYDFSDKLSGNLYYVFPSPTTYADTIFIDLQNGEMGAITRYKLFVSCRQSDDFTFTVTFKPELSEDGYHEIKFSELITGIDNPIVLTVKDANEFSKFNYMITWQNMSLHQQHIAQYFTIPGISMPRFDVYGRWLANDFGYLIEQTQKQFGIAVRQQPNEDNANQYLGEFNWVYDVRRESGGMRKACTLKIRVIDDR